MSFEDKGFLVVAGIWIVGILINVTIVGGIIWAAVHFISKYW